MRAPSPEARFITLCVCTPGAVRHEAVVAAASDVRSWPAVVNLATYHRVAGFVLQAVATTKLPVPADTVHALRRATLGSLSRTMLLNSVLTQLLSALDLGGVPVIVLKGPVLATTIYPRVALRPYDDLDLLVDAEHEFAAERVATSLGFAERPYGAEERRRAHASRGHRGAAFHRTFLSAHGRVMLELHTDPLQLGLQPICEDDRWQRAVPIPQMPAGRMLCPEDQIVQLSVHVHKHGYSRLIWLKDLDLLLRSPDVILDWGLIATTACREGVQGSVWYGLHLARTMLLAPVPDIVLACLRPSPPVRVLYRLVWPLARTQALNGHMRRRAVQFHEADSLRGMLPSLILMGRRRDRLSAALATLVGR